MKSYIKIYGPPVLKAIKALEKVAVEMPEVCIWNINIEKDLPQELASYKIDFSSRWEDDVDFSSRWEARYFSGLDNIPDKRCGTIISKSGEKLGEYDFYFEWFKDPTNEELSYLIEKIDNALAPLGCKYTITTK